jgi:hypothetical protein
MRKFGKSAAAAAIVLGAGTASAYAACNGDTSTETVLGAASGATVGGLASHSVAGAAIGGIAGGLIGNAIGSSNNREDCRREAYYYDRDRYAYNDDYAPPPAVTYYDPAYDTRRGYVDRYDTHSYYDDFPD